MQKSSPFTEAATLCSSASTPLGRYFSNTFCFFFLFVGMSCMKTSWQPDTTDAFQKTWLGLTPYKISVISPGNRMECMQHIHGWYQTEVMEGMWKLPFNKPEEWGEELHPEAHQCQMWSIATRQEQLYARGEIWTGCTAAFQNRIYIPCISQENCVQ